MENIPQKADFLKHDYTRQLAAIDPNAERRWGKMNVQQMIEHMSDSFRIANGKDPQKLITSAEHLPKMQEFLRSEKDFRENTVNRLMGDTPLPMRHKHMADAITELQVEIDDFFKVYEQTPGLAITNPFFGDLDYDMSVQLLHKHAIHHLRQFGGV